jgi:hypothetical protein
MTGHRFTRSAALGLALAALSAPTAAAHPTDVRSNVAGDAAAQKLAGVVAVHWAAKAPTTLGAEPPGPCLRLDARHAACPIGIALLVHHASTRRPWRCSAKVLVARAGGRLAARRTGTHCAPFPPPATVPDPAAALGTAFVLDAIGDIACLPAGAGRTTCVLSYVARTAERCIRAASVPLATPARSVALGVATCRRS